ncbi:disease resistance protein L6-like [Syzygium oleosum]|uniref:disease resistance protein L6-like n=1 Tax=Syzygium oleosum TaxID=219896 RepID=UPI0024B95C60|nr:disease resistance protein L6-like [Syzygium oleosum]
MEGSAKKRRICENDGTAGGASSTHTSTEGQGMATSYDYEVFLSFRGPDTRAGFTDFLYTSLIATGIRAFKDDEDLRKGEEFAPELLQAIKQSKILIPIFSKDYASSVWCLKEVVQMVECKNNGGQKIIPIFYDVAPAEVRYQTGDYEKAFLSHESKKRYDQKTIREWKDALRAVGEINGHNLQSMPNRQEGEFATKLTKEVFRELKRAYLVVSDYLVSVDDHVDAIMEMIGAETSETRIVGIHGMGGIGKTTIAKIIYNQLSKNFEGCCFLSNVRETSKLKGIHHLQHQLISDILNTKWIDIRNIDEGIKTIKDRLSNKRVLLLLDDVEEKDHMNALIGNHDWFGKGSKLIITTRNKEVLKLTKVDNLYEVNVMDFARSLQLFSKHAFRRDSPLDEHIDQSKRAIGIAGGLPLALEVIGSLLPCIDKKKWDDKLEQLEKVPHLDVQSKLKISFDALEVRQQHIFLDIACFFIGYDKDIMVHFWEKSKYFPEEVMEVLQNMSLIKIRWGNKVWMHDQLRDIGREIVHQESKMKIEKQSRVWDPKEALDLLRRRKGKTKVEALCLNLDNQWQYRFTYEGFESLSYLRFLEVGGSMENFCAEARLLWHELTSNVPSANENSDLLPQLRWLSWRRIPPIFNITNFSMEDVVFLDLSSSEITDDWKGWRHMEVMKNLKVLDLSYCRHLKRTPNFSVHSNLERLILSSCPLLTEIDRSICQLKRLVSLDVSNCENLQRLPGELGGDLASLKYLSLRSCRLLERLPDTIGNLESLIEMDISITRIKELPDSIGKLKNLKVVKMEHSGISKIPDAFWTIEKLEEIHVGRNRMFAPERCHVNIGNCISRNQSLRILRLDGVDIYALPLRLPESLIDLSLEELCMDTFPDLSYLTNLKKLNLRFRGRDYDGKSYGPVEDPIPRWMGNLSNLESLALRFDCETASPTDLSLPTQLKSLDLKCGITTLPTALPPQLESLRLSTTKLRHLPSLPPSLSSLRLEGCDSLCSMEDLSNLKNLSSLGILGAAIAEIRGLGCLDGLRDMDLKSLGQVKILPDLSNLNKLRRLDVCYCFNLVEIQGELPRFLDGLYIYSCPSLLNLPDLSSLVGRQRVVIKNCAKLNEGAILAYARMKPRDLWLLGFDQLQILRGLSYSNELRCLHVDSYRNLVEIQGELPQSLEELRIYYWESLRKLPDLSSLKGLRMVCIRSCCSLAEIQGELPQSLEKLEIYDCESLQKLPNLSSLKGLREVSISSCGSLAEIQGELPQSLEKLNISFCESLQKLPDLSSLKGLRKVEINRCKKLDVEAISSLCSEKGVEFLEEDNEWDGEER